MHSPVLVISGGTRGIGKAIVSRFLDGGFRVFASGFSASSVAAACTEFAGRDADFQVVDAGDPKAWARWAQQIGHEAGGVQVLVLNAGVFLPGSIQSEVEGVFESQVRNNLASAYHGARAILPLMKNRRPAHIFSVCSTASVQSYPNGGSYCITKHGLLGLTRVLREELATEGIGVTALVPGATFTDSWRDSPLPSSRFMKPSDLADLVWAAWQVSPSAVAEEILIRPMEGDI
jgi:NAD(P)-dependent dehydrogenase (short-subunit alcohol dehydrogenase family)